MAEYSGFFNCTEGTEDHVYDADDFANFFHMYLQNGIFAESLSSLQVVPKSGRTVTVKKGKALIDGHWYILDADKDLNITANSSSSSRLTTVVCNLNKSQKQIKLITLDSPAYSGLPRTDGVNVDLVLCKITCKPSFSSLSVSDIQDVRASMDYCGWVSSILETTDLDSLYTDIRNQFDTWFREINEKLGDEPATKLQLQINEILQSPIDTVDEIKQNKEQNKFVGALALKGAMELFGNASIKSQSVIVNGLKNVTSAWIYTLNELKEMFSAPSATYKNFTFIVNNGDGNANDSHIEGCAWIDQNKLYVVFDRTTTGNVRINFTIIYVPTENLIPQKVLKF